MCNKYHEGYDEGYDDGAESRQDEVDKLQAEIDGLQKRIEKLESRAKWHIEDCACSHPMSEYQLGWFDAMNLVLETLKGEN